ncbi:MAG: hypothetical protein KDC92_13475 [Bacteroidetes bacterium]|nr:hypothetical protein [Bacteroidota bacterium]
MNADQQFILEGIVHTFDFVNGTMRLQDTTIDTTISQDFGSNKRYNCFDFVRQHPPKEKSYGSNVKIGAYKYHAHTGYVECVGTMFRYYEKNSNGKWKRKRKRKTIFLDKWHEIKWKKYSVTYGNYLSTNTKTNKKSSRRQKSFCWEPVSIQREITIKDQNNNVTYRENFAICLDKFERLHCYLDGDFNNDLHNDPWVN